MRKLLLLSVCVLLVQCASISGTVGYPVGDGKAYVTGGMDGFLLGYRVGQMKVDPKRVQEPARR